MFVLNGGIDGIKVVKTIAGFPILFLEIGIMLMFLIYMARRSMSGALQREMMGALPAEADAQSRAYEDHTL